LRSDCTEAGRGDCGWLGAATRQRHDDGVGMTTAKNNRTNIFIPSLSGVSSELRTTSAAILPLVRENTRRVAPGRAAMRLVERNIEFLTCQNEQRQKHQGLALCRDAHALGLRVVLRSGMPLTQPLTGKAAAAQSEEDAGHRCHQQPRWAAGELKDGCNVGDQYFSDSLITQPRL
jgi:hypothetical protein